MVVTCMEQAGGWRRLVGACTHLEGVLLLARCGAGVWEKQGHGGGQGQLLEGELPFGPVPVPWWPTLTTTCEACLRTCCRGCAAQTTHSA